jgi:hypothetical protein
MRSFHVKQLKGRGKDREHISSTRRRDDFAAALWRQGDSIPYKALAKQWKQRSIAQ